MYYLFIITLLYLRTMDLTQKDATGEKEKVPVQKVELDDDLFKEDDVNEKRQEELQKHLDMAENPSTGDVDPESQMPSNEFLEKLKESMGKMSPHERAQFLNKIRMAGESGNAGEKNDATGFLQQMQRQLSLNNNKFSTVSDNQRKSTAEKLKDSINALKMARTKKQIKMKQQENLMAQSQPTKKEQHNCADHDHSHSETCTTTPAKKPHTLLENTTSNNNMTKSKMKRMKARLRAHRKKEKNETSVNTTSGAETSEKVDDTTDTKDTKDTKTE